MMRSSSLSNSRVISKINQDFVPIHVDITRDGFPDLVGLEMWRKASRAASESQELRSALEAEIVEAIRTANQCKSAGGRRSHR